MRRSTKTKTDVTNPLGAPRVAGLEGGQQRADRRHRRNRTKGRIITFIAMACALAVVAAGAYVGYSVYVEQQNDDAEETERRFAEIEADRDGETVGDIISNLEEQPRFNGNAPPGFDDDSIIEVIRPPEP